ANAHEADVEYLALDVAEGPLQAYPITHADAVRGHHREISDKSQDHVLERERDTRGGESQRGDQHGKLAREVEDEHDGDGHYHDDVARHEQQAAPVGIVHVAAGRHAPEHAPDEDGGYRDDDADEPDSKALQDLPLIAVQLLAPRVEIGGKA